MFKELKDRWKAVTYLRSVLLTLPKGRQLSFSVSAQENGKFFITSLTNDKLVYIKKGTTMNEVNTVDAQMAQAVVMAGAETEVPETPVALQPEETTLLIQTDEDVGPVAEDVVTVH